MKTSEPFTNRQFFLGTLVLSALAFIPLIGWLSAFFLIVWLIVWMVMEPQGFFSIVWRTMLSVVLIYSGAVIIETFVTREHVNVYEDQFLIGSIIASALSAFGLVRSFFKARKERALASTME